MTPLLPPTPVLDLLADAAQGLGPDAQRVVAVLTDDASLVRGGPAALLDRAGTRLAVLERLLAQAGLANFAELQARVDADENRQLSTQGARYRARIRRTTSSADLMDRVAEQEQENLRRTLDALRTNGTLQVAARRIVAARRRFVLGSGKSQAYARLLATDLAAGLAGVTLVDAGSAGALDMLSDTRPGDLLVAFSLRRYVRDTLAIAREFHAAGGTIVGVTDASDAPLAATADVTIVVGTSSASYVDSPTAVAAAVHLLATLTTASAKGARRRLDRRGRLAESLDVYADSVQTSGGTVDPEEVRGGRIHADEEEDGRR